MKISFMGAVLLVLTVWQVIGQTALAQLPAEPSYAVAVRGADQAVWQKTIQEIGPDGEEVPRIRQYIELATGLHYQKDGQWVESKEEIELLPQGGAAAVQGQHKAYFPSDIYQGMIELVTSSGLHLKSRPLGISYDDGNQAVFIAELKSSVGELVGPNQIVYADAFEGLKADLRFTYKKSGLEQDVILREQPAAPAHFGLEAENVRLQVFTEFFNTEDPQVVRQTDESEKNPADSTLKFGSMTMVRGRCFSTTDSEKNSRKMGSPAVSKSWVDLENRKFLVEQLPLQQLDSHLKKLPLRMKSASTSPEVPRRKASTKRALPPARLAKISTNSIQMAKADLAVGPGLVVDYEILSGEEAGYTFEADKTYLITDAFVTYGGPAVFEGGTIIKFDTEIPSATYILAWSGVVCKTSPYRPAVFTSRNDDTIGEVISDPGTPMNYSCPLHIDSAGADLQYLRILYADSGLHFTYGTQVIRNSQFVHCGIALYPEWETCVLENVLISDVDAAFGGAESQISGTFVTIDNCAQLTSPWDDPASSSVTLTNSLLVNVAADGDVAITTDHTERLSGSSVFQKVGAGGYYLASSSPYRNAGTLNVSPESLAGIKTKTTYPPIVYNVPGAYFSTSLNLFPQAQRDTDAPDLGYHYDPLDYMFGGLYVTNATITLNPGTAIGMYGTNGIAYGVGISVGSRFFAQGAADNLCRIVAYNTVQETTNAGWQTPSYALVPSVWSSDIRYNCRFTDWSVMAQDTAHCQFSGDGGPIRFLDCQFHGGKVASAYPTINFTNCLLERVNVDLEPADANIAVIRNNLIYGGTFGFGPGGDYWTNSIIRDNLFDQTVIPDWIGGYGGSYYGGYNAYVTNCNRLQPTFGSDIILATSPAYQVGPLGNYYYPTNLSLINGGSVTNAGLVGLYHYTTTTNQVKDANSRLDIGFHYVAANANRLELDTDGDGIPDYLEDANGNGAVNSGETDWQSATDLGLKVLITRPKSTSTIP